MDLFFPEYPEKKFHLKLLSNASKDVLKEFQMDDNILILNADYVIFKYLISNKQIIFLDFKCHSYSNSN